MSHDESWLPTVVRETIHDLSAEVRSVDLTADVLRQGRRLQRRRAGLMLAAAAGTVASIVAVVATLPGAWRGSGEATPGVTASEPTVLPSPSASTVQPSPSAPTILPGGWIVGAVTGGRVFSFTTTYSQVWDRTSQQYVQVPYPMVIPAPVGGLALVARSGSAYGLLDIGSGEVTWLDELDGRFSAYDLPAWSADGRYVAAVGRSEAYDFAIQILDVADRSVRTLPRVWYPDSYCADYCMISWYDDDTLALPIGHNDSEALAPRYTGLRLISAVDGSQEGTLDLPGAFASLDDWSTDGRYVTLMSLGLNMPGGRAVVYDTQEGREVVETVDPVDVWWVSPTEWLEFVPERLDPEPHLRLVGIDGISTTIYPVPPVPGADHVVLVRP